MPLHLSTTACHYILPLHLTTISPSSELFILTIAFITTIETEYLV